MRAQFLTCFILALTFEHLSSAHIITAPERNETNPGSAKSTLVHSVQGHAESLRGRTRASPPPQKRSHPTFQLSSGWALHLQSTSTFLPIPIATNALAVFYQDIMRFAVQAAEEAENEVMDLTVQIGNLFLDFVATEQLSPVSWELVHDVAVAMLRMTEKGFAGGYHAVLKNGVSLVVVRIGLKALRANGAANAAWKV